MSLPHDPPPFLPYEVRVKLRRADKTLAWQKRAHFLVEGDAHDYADKWRTLGQVRVVQRETPKSSVSQ